MKRGGKEGGIGNRRGWERGRDGKGRGVESRCGEGERVRGEGRESSRQGRTQTLRPTHSQSCLGPDPTRSKTARRGKACPKLLPSPSLPSLLPFPLSPSPLSSPALMEVSKGNPNRCREEPGWMEPLPCRLGWAPGPACQLSCRPALRCPCLSSRPGRQPQPPRAAEPPLCAED